MSKLSEEEQLKRAMEESLKSHDEAMEELGVKILDEEEQLQMALGKFFERYQHLISYSFSFILRGQKFGNC